MQSRSRSSRRFAVDESPAVVPLAVGLRRALQIGPEALGLMHLMQEVCNSLFELPGIWLHQEPSRRELLGQGD